MLLGCLLLKLSATLWGSSSSQHLRAETTHRCSSCQPSWSLSWKPAAITRHGVNKPTDGFCPQLIPSPIFRSFQVRLQTPCSRSTVSFLNSWQRESTQKIKQWLFHAKMFGVVYSFAILAANVFLLFIMPFFYSSPGQSSSSLTEWLCHLLDKYPSRSFIYTPLLWCLPFSLFTSSLPCYPVSFLSTKHFCLDAFE